MAIAMMHLFVISLLPSLTFSHNFPVEKSVWEYSIASLPKQSYAQSQSKSEVQFHKIMQYAAAQNLRKKPIGEIMQAIAMQFLGTPYQAGLLDQLPQEQLVVTLDKFDCMLFIESVLAIARNIAAQDVKYASFDQHIRTQRYRRGEVKGYCSRIHYFSEWIAENEKQGVVQNITSQLGGIKLNKQLNFMSQNRQSYRQLANAENFKCIQGVEANLKNLNIHYIPTHEIRRHYAQMQSGDIIAIATDIPGLDVTHTGLIYRHSDQTTGLIHASPSGAVKISPDLQTYVAGVKNSIGIMIVRAKVGQSISIL